MLIHDALARPNHSMATRDEAPKKFEWTALGDSYASGVGSTNYVDGRRCLRYDEAWPRLLNNDNDLAEGDYIFNNVVCSGAHYDDVEKYQFYDEDTSNKPNIQYGKNAAFDISLALYSDDALGPRPKFGNPQMATLAIGGDDIDFPGILFSEFLFCLSEVDHDSTTSSLHRNARVRSFIVL